MNVPNIEVWFHGDDVQHEWEPLESDHYLSVIVGKMGELRVTSVRTVADADIETKKQEIIATPLAVYNARTWDRMYTGRDHE